MTIVTTDGTIVRDPERFLDLAVELVVGSKRDLQTIMLDMRGHIQTRLQIPEKIVNDPAINLCVEMAKTNHEIDHHLMHMIARCRSLNGALHRANIHTDGELANVIMNAKRPDGIGRIYIGEIAAYCALRYPANYTERLMSRIISRFFETCSTEYVAARTEACDCYNRIRQIYKGGATK